jgi:hypothetical protein
MIRMKDSGWVARVALVFALTGCNSLDKPADGSENEPRLVIPVDERAPLTSPVTPPPISGGTLSVLSDGSAAIVADPERDQISIVDLRTLSVRHTLALVPGDEPGRSVEDAQKHVHVALRRGGAVVTIDPLTGTVLDRRAVCKAPRGIAFESATGLLHVACSEGKLVSLPALGGGAVRTLTLDVDLRDVLVRGSELWLTRFKSAEVLRVSSLGALAGRLRIPAGTGLSSQPAQDFSAPSAQPKEVRLEAGTAWRTVSTLAGGAIIVHQDAVADPIEITEPTAFGSAYGGTGLGCSGIVRNAVSVVSASGSVTSSQFFGSPLPVDVALSTDQRWVAVAHAGPSDIFAPRPSLVSPGEQGPSAGTGSAFGGGISLSIMALTDLNGRSTCVTSEGRGIDGVPVTAVAFTPDGRLLAQSREPAQLLIMSDLPYGNSQVLALPGGSRADTAHDLFHRDAGGGIACASCHPEGGEDGRTWHFSDSGDRRTQALHVGLRDTAPFHWNGDLPGIDALMTQVFVGRMGGIRESAPRVSALSEWIFALKPPASIREPGDEPALRGRELFESAAVGCTSCHSGPHLTDNRNVAIDSVSTGKLQVPSLVAVGYRAPFMHNGCAATLSDRFDPKCGGNEHGNTAALSDAQRGDLVAYLESL